MNISAVILTKNEGSKIALRISELKFCDEVVVIDDDSEDQTVKIAKDNKALVYKHSLNNDFSLQRNFGLDKAHGKWVLFVDCDEKVTQFLRKEILSKISDKNNTYMGFFIRRRDVFFGKKLKHGESGNMKLLRLARKDAGIWERCVHEDWRVEGKVGILKNMLFHYPHPTMNDFIDNINKFSSLHALANAKEGKRSNILKIIFFPFFKFIQNFILRLGIIDGPQGLIVAVMMSLHSYLSWSKLWLLQRKGFYPN